jgi:hypothetical protein
MLVIGQSNGAFHIDGCGQPDHRVDGSGRLSAFPGFFRRSC